MAVAPFPVVTLPPHLDVHTINSYSSEMWNERHSRAGRDILIFALAVLLLVLLWENNLLATLAIVALFLARSCCWREKGDLAVYLVGAILGPSTEIIATRLGIWTYACPSFLNIPLWLPFAWGFAAVLFVRIAQSLLGSR